MRSIRLPLALLGTLLGLAVLIQPGNTEMFGSCCLIAAAVSILAIASAIDAHKYRAIGVHAALLSVYAYGIVTIAH